MRFLDPIAITCPSCEEDGKYKVSDLLNLQASCKTCGYSLSSIGRRMRAAVNHAEKWVSLVELALKLEEKLNVEYEDADLEPLLEENKSAKIRDILDLTLTKLPPNHNYQEIQQLVYESISVTGEYSVNQLDTEMSLFEALGVAY